MKRYIPKPGKVLEKRKCPGQILENSQKYIFLEEINDHKGYGSIFLAQITFLVDLNVDLENAYEKVWEPCELTFLHFIIPLILRFCDLDAYHNSHNKITPMSIS